MLRFNADSTALVSESRDGTIRLWDVTTGELGKTLTGHMAPVNSLAFSADGTTLRQRGLGRRHPSVGC